MKIGKLIVFVILVAAILVFNFLFKDKLVERGLEQGLERVFQARAEVTDLKFQLFQTQVHFEHLQVADRDAPMKNLFELGSTRIDFNLEELLKKKFVIEDITCREIRWNTDREDSGVLETEEPIEAAAQEQESKSFSADKLAGFLDFDPGRLIDEQQQALKSFAAVDSINTAIGESTERWQQSLDGLDQDLDAVSDGMTAVSKIDFGSIKSIAAAQKAYSEVEDLIPRVNDLGQELKQVNSGIQTDLKTAQQEVSAISRTIQQDSDYLKGLVQVPEGGLKGLMSALVQKTLQRKLGRFYGVTMKAKNAALKLRERRREKKKKTARRAGEDIPFPSSETPRFLIKHFGLSMSEGRSVAAEIWDLNSDPDLWNKPTRFDADYREGSSTVLASGEVDTRSQAQRLLDLDLQADNFPFELENPDMVQMSYIRGSYTFDTKLTIDKNDQTQGSARIRIRSLEMDPAGKEDLVTRIVYDALESSSEVVLDVVYKVTAPEKQLTLTVQSNLDEVISAQLSREVDTLVADYQDRINAELQKRLAPELQNNKALLGSLQNVQASGLQDQAQINDYTKSLTTKQEEFKQSLLKLGGQKTLKDATKKLKLPGGSGN